MSPELLFGVALAVVMAVLFLVVVLLVLPIRIDVPLARVGAVIDRAATLLGLREPCPTCGVPSQELGRKGSRIWLYCPACGRNPWPAGMPEQPRDRADAVAS